MAPAECIVVDTFGRAAHYDTCYRAEPIFGVEEAIPVTQWFRTRNQDIRDAGAEEAKRWSSLETEER